MVKMKKGRFIKKETWNKILALILGKYKLIEEIIRRIQSSWLRYILFIIFIIFMIFVYSIIIYDSFKKVSDFCNHPFTATIQIVDWCGKTNNPEIKEKEFLYGATLSLDGQQEKLTGNTIKYTYTLPILCNKKDVRIQFNPKSEYQFMQLDTVLHLNRKLQIYLVRMYFKGIDKITRQVIDANTGKPVIGAIAEIAGVKDTTNNEGYFTLKLPLLNQKRYQELVIRKNGYSAYRDCKLDMTLNNPIIVWEIE